MRRLPEWLMGAALALTASVASAQEIYQEKSLYRNIVVYEEQGLRCMKFGRQGTGRQTCISLKNPDALVLNYTKMLLGALYLKPEPQRILIIGLGGGSLPSALKKIVPQAMIETVELDPSVAKVAERFFGFMPGKDNAVAIEDGRVFVKRAQKQGKKYDLVILDAFDHVYVPEHMLTREYLLEVKSLLEKDGVLAANTFSSSRLYDAESATYAGVFGGFYNLKTENRVILAKNDGLPPMAQIQANAGRLEQKLNHFGTGKDWLLPLFSIKADWPAGTRILTDQYSPANLLNGSENRNPWWRFW
ncbi:spermidine synthase [Polaromonas sp. DSR2-3-2]|uniref:spermidine synthase n=1 Tax=unclassified Polaromonas TaxID=2638319 RepID=UPI003CEF12E8